jgi:hypothetical protein
LRPDYDETVLTCEDEEDITARWSQGLPKKLIKLLEEGTSIQHLALGGWGSKVRLTHSAQHTAHRTKTGGAAGLS